MFRGLGFRISGFRVEGFKVRGKKDQKKETRFSIIPNKALASLGTFKQGFRIRFLTADPESCLALQLCR